MPKARMPAVPLRFGGEDRSLKFDFNALAELQDLAGTYLSDTPKLKALRAALWAGLLHETLDRRGRETARTLSLVQVGEILSDMDAGELETLVQAVLEAQGLAAAPNTENPPPPPAPAA